MLERDMWKKLKEAGRCRELEMYRIENRTGRVPDIYFSSGIKSGWIELKNCKVSKDCTTVNIPFRPGQLAWIHKFRWLHNRIYLVFTIGDSWFMFSDYDIKKKYMTDTCYYQKVSVEEIIKKLVA
jgi:hypothetical protein